MRVIADVVTANMSNISDVTCISENVKNVAANLLFFHGPRTSSQRNVNSSWLSHFVYVQSTFLQTDTYFPL